MTTPTEQIALQNEAYRQSLLKDIETRNTRVIELMDATVTQQEQEESQSRLDAMNNLDPVQRRRLMGGEKLEDILRERFKKSKYYNTTNDAANAIPKNELFEYQIGNHFMAYEIRDIKLNHELKTVDFPVVAYDPDAEEYIDLTYTVRDDDVFEILKHQLEPPTSVQPMMIDSLSSSESAGLSSPEIPFSYEYENIDDIPDWVKEDYEDPPFSEHGFNPNTAFVNPTPSAPPIRDPFASTDKSIRNIQDKLFEQLLSIYQGENMYSSQVYTPEMENRIRQMLKNNFFPFQIVNNIISEFTTVINGYQ